MSNTILKRKYYAIEIETISPINVSGGEDELTDSDVLRNGQGMVFVPGTSLAGAFRNYFHQRKDEKSAFGFSKDNEGQMSSIYVSDMYFKNAPKVSVRDRIKLGEQKENENKFDQEIIETGALAVIYLNFVCRENDIWDFDSVAGKILQGIESGEIRIGANKNRGFGRLSIRNIYEKTFSKANVDEWIEFASNSQLLSCYGTAKTYNQWLDENNKILSEYVKIRIPLKLQGGISIRKYSTEPNKADYEHLFCNGVPVIPGTSWNGAIRSESVKILKELGIDKSVIKNYINEWFGYVDGKNGRQSRVIIGESILKNATPVPMTRSNINRFSAASSTGALYTEISCFGGTTVLEIMLSKEESDYQAFLGLMLLVIQNIQKGYLSIGGQSAIGRGIFGKDDNNSIEFSEELSEAECLKQLYAYLYERTK